MRFAKRRLEGRLILMAATSRKGDLPAMRAHLKRTSRENNVTLPRLLKEGDEDGGAMRNRRGSAVGDKAEFFGLVRRRMGPQQTMSVAKLRPHQIK
jgi:hypothetical protein